MNHIFQHLTPEALARTERNPLWCRGKVYLVELLECKHRSILPRLGGWKLQVELLLFLAFLCKTRDDPCFSILQPRSSPFFP